MAVAVARDVPEAQLQCVVIGSSGIACVVTVAAVVDGTVMESAQESATSSVHNIIIYCQSYAPDHFYSNTIREILT